MKAILILGAALVAGACTSGPKAAPMSSARIITGDGVTGGDCAEARRRAAAQPDLPVDKLPSLVRQEPRAFLRMPASVRRLVNRQGASVKADVVIDTLGRPVMSTFAVVESKPHAWMARNIRSNMPKWRFAPAELAGCKVPRVFKFSAVAPKRG